MPAAAGAPVAVEEQAAATLRLSVVVPATDAPPTLARCVAAIDAATDPPAEVLVITDPTNGTPTAARNTGALIATGDILVFIDADIEVHPDAFRRIRNTLSTGASVTAVFGSYDDTPGDDGVVSQFRNLLHHHVHQASPGAIETFWAGIGAVRRDVFAAAGGFVDHPIEDVEFGMRLTAAGASIVLDPDLLGTHLKRWTIPSMVRTDLLTRGAPWIALALRHRTVPNYLNWGWRHRVSALSSVGVLGALVLQCPEAAVGALGSLVVLNWSFYGLLLRRSGPAIAAAGIGLHVIHHLTAVAAIPTGIAVYIFGRSHSPAVNACASVASA
jgi:GT2 family glycosyltransferase